MKQIHHGKNTVLLVDDETLILRTTSLSLQASGIEEVLTLSDSREVLPLLADNPVAVILLDLHMPHLSGLELLARINQQQPQIPVILMTANDEVETVVEAMKLGAFDYLVKPVETSRLVATVRKALELRSLASELSSLKQYMLTDQLEHPEIFAAIVTGDKKMRSLFQYLEVIAPTRQPILITGETGVGKELVAQVIHDLSGSRGEFVAVNVAGLDDSLFADSLFGHRKGAYTGADQARVGLIAQATGGTLFLDEIGDLSEPSQIKLLRLMQEQEYYPVGSDLLKKSDARIVLATNHNLQQLMAEGRFRTDLYYRLFAHQVQIPPLRDRLNDLPLLLDHFLTLSAESLHKKKPTPPAALVDLLGAYPFPGNVRELEAMVFDAVARHGSGVLSMETFRTAIGDHRPLAPRSSNGHPPEECTLTTIFGHFPTIAEVEEYMILEAMKRSKGNQGVAARLLGMGRQTLNKRLNRSTD